MWHQCMATWISVRISGWSICLKFDIHQHFSWCCCIWASSLEALHMLLLSSGLSSCRAATLMLYAWPPHSSPSQENYMGHLSCLFWGELSVLCVLQQGWGVLQLCLLTHWGRDKMAAIFQTIFSNAFSWMKMDEFRLTFHWSLFLRVQLTIFQHWFR